MGTRKSQPRFLLDTCPIISPGIPSLHYQIAVPSTSPARLYYHHPSTPQVLQLQKEKKIKDTLPPDSHDQPGISPSEVVPQTSDELARLRLQKETEALQIERLQLELACTAQVTKNRLIEKERTNSPEKNLLVISKPRKRSLLCKNSLTFSLQVSQKFFMNLLLQIFPQVMLSY